MLILNKGLEDSARDFKLLLDGLVGIGVCSYGYGPTGILGVVQRLMQSLYWVSLVVDLCFKVQSRREIKKGVRWTREAIDASVLAPLVRIDRTIKRHVRRLVGGDQFARLVREKLRYRRIRRKFGGQEGVNVPTVVFGYRSCVQVTRRGADRSSPALD